MISIVLPVYNEEANVRMVYDRLKAALQPLQETHELVFVDDGSSDDSVAILRHLCKADPRVKVVSLSRNFGHQIAISAGLEHATGDAVVVMDADLQHPPEVVPRLVEKWKEGFDVVYTIRSGTEHGGWFKRRSAALFYRLLNSICEIQITPNAPDFRLMDRRVVDALLRMPERARFLRGLVTWVGFRQVGIEFVAARREAGTTKYPLSKMLRLSLDGVTAFSFVPLRLASYLGLLAALAGLPYGLWAVYARLFTDSAVHGWASVIVAVLFLGGVQLVAIGIMGEYLGRIYEEVKGRPLYIAREIIAGRADERGSTAFDERTAVEAEPLALPARRRPAKARAVAQ